MEERGDRKENKDLRDSPVFLWRPCLNFPFSAPAIPARFRS